MDQPDVNLTSCPHCAAQMPQTAAFCPGCGRPMSKEGQTEGQVPHKDRVGAFPENIAAALAYMTFVPATVFLFRGPYNKNRFVRFHSVQSLLLCLAGASVAAGLRLAGLVLIHLPVLGPLLIVVLWAVVLLALVLSWLVLVVKALQGETFLLPVLGNFAELYADFR